MAEFEELKLTVNLTDNASAGLANIRVQIVQLAQATDVVATGLNKVAASATQVGQAAQQAAPKISSQEKSLKELTRSAEETSRGLVGMALAARRGTEAFPELALATREAFTGLKGVNVAMGELGAASRLMVVGLGSVVVGIAAIGAAVVAYGISVFKFSQEMYTLSQTAKSLGMTFGSLKNITEQNERFGISVDATVGQLAKMNDALTDLSMSGSKVRQSLLSQGVPAKFIDDYLRLTNTVDRYNKVREGQIKVHDDWLKRTGSEEVAATQAGRFGQQFGVDPTAFTRAPLEQPSAKELEQSKRIAEESARIAEHWRETLKIIGDIKTEFLSWGLPGIAPIITGINEGLKHTVGMFEAIGHAIEAIKHATPDWLGTAISRGWAAERGALGGLITGGPIGALKGGYKAYQDSGQPAAPPVQGGDGAHAPAAPATPATPAAPGGSSSWMPQGLRQWNTPPPGYQPTSFGGAANDNSGGGRAQSIIKGGVYEALVEFYGFLQGGAKGGVGGGGGIVPASFGGAEGAAAGGGVGGGAGGRAPGAAGFGGGGYTNLSPGANAAGRAGLPHGSDVGPGTGAGAGSTPGRGPMVLGKGDDPRGMESHIRETAKKYGVDPDTAVRVAKSEGLRDFSGDKGKSGGAFQLYTGGGLGNEFQKETGLDPLDPKNEKATIDYALKRASTGGWGPWHGAKRVGVGPREGLPGGTPPTTAGADGAAPQGPFSDRPSSERKVNYFQSRGDKPLEQGQLATVDTPYGKVRAHPEAAQDLAKFTQSMKEAGAPIQNFGDYNKRMKRAYLGGSGWSSHAYGAAWDIDNKTELSPAMKQWIAANPDKFKEALKTGNMRQPLPQTDAPHIEWTGPSAGESTTAGADRPGINRSALNPPLDRSALNDNNKISSTGKLSVDVNAPPGSKVDYSGDNLLRATSMQRQTQMMPTDTGPSVSDTARSYMRGGS